MDKQKRFVFIDSNSLIHRAYHAYPLELTTSNGEIINAVYGFSFLLLKIIEDLKPDYIVSVFDVPKPTKRHEKFKEYKIHRKPMEPELAVQFPPVKEVIRAFNIPILEVAGYEADDVIGTIEDNPSIKGLEKIIVTGDQDIFQLVDDDTKVYLSGRNFRESSLYGINEVKKRMGLSPKQVVDFKAIFGDPSDNIPGVSGIGKVGALKLIELYKTLDGIYEHIDEIEGRYRKKLIENKDTAYLSQDLATIMRDAPVAFDLAACKWEDFSVDDVKKVFQKYEFRSLLRTLEKVSPNQAKSKIEQRATPSDAKESLEKVSTAMELSRIFEKIKKISCFALAVFPDNAGVNSMLPALMSVSIDGTKSYVFDLRLVFLDGALTSEGKLLKKLLENEEIKKVGHDVKVLLHSLQNIGIAMRGISFDIMLAAYVVQSGSGATGLSELTFHYLGKSLDAESASGQKSFSYDWGIESSFVFQMYKLLERKLEDSNNGVWSLYKLYKELELPLTYVLAKMERNGILVDRKYLLKFASELDRKIAKEEQEVYNLVGHEFNLNSSSQVADVIFEELNLPQGGKTAKGRASTSSGILSKLAGTHPVIEHLLLYRELAKLRSTYTTSLLAEIDQNTGRIHTSFNQAVTSTGRLSSSKPNLQNIPISSEMGKEVRKAFVAPKGSRLVSFDYSQQELRILAHLTKDENLINAFNNDQDIHALTASKLFGKGITSITKQERRVAKTINFGVMYGMSAVGLAESLSISRGEAATFINRYFDEYSAVKRFYDTYLTEAKAKGYAVTIFGRRRSASLLSTINRGAYGAIMRELINFPIQGSAADMMKFAMIKVDKEVEKKYSQKARMLLQIHDELVFEYKGALGINSFAKDIQTIMEQVYQLRVPIRVEYCVGNDLAEIH